PVPALQACVLPYWSWAVTAKAKLLPAVGAAVAVVSTSLLAGAALTIRLAVAEKVLAESEAVRLCGPALIRVAEKVRWPFVRVEFAGSDTPDELSLRSE